MPNNFEPFKCERNPHINSTTFIKNKQKNKQKQKLQYSLISKALFKCVVVKI